MELFFNLGVFSCDQAENRALFDGIHAIISRRLAQGAREVMQEERSRWSERVKTVSRS